jgi:hypothetical protein
MKETALVVNLPGRETMALFERGDEPGRALKRRRIRIGAGMRL